MVELEPLRKRCDDCDGEGEQDDDEMCPECGGEGYTIESLTIEEDVL